VLNGTVTQTDYVNPRAPVNIVSGAAGCNEDLGLCWNPILGPGGPWSNKYLWGPEQYGYGRFWATNASSFHFEEVQLINEGQPGVIWASIDVLQGKHGPFV
jgi:hypothetical protein